MPRKTLAAVTGFGHAAGILSRRGPASAVMASLVNGVAARRIAAAKRTWLAGGTVERQVEK
jgi:hypothetical protein